MGVRNFICKLFGICTKSMALQDKGDAWDFHLKNLDVIMKLEQLAACLECPLYSDEWHHHNNFAAYLSILWLVYPSPLWFCHQNAFGLCIGPSTFVMQFPYASGHDQYNRFSQPAHHHMASFFLQQKAMGFTVTITHKLTVPHIILCRLQKINQVCHQLPQKLHCHQNSFCKLKYGFLSGPYKLQMLGLYFPSAGKTHTFSISQRNVTPTQYYIQ